MWGSRTVAGGTAGSAKPPVLLFSTMYGVQALFLPQGRRQTSTDSELLSVLVSSSWALHLHRFSILYEPTVHLTDSDYCLIAWGGQAATVGLARIAPFPS